MLIVTHLHRENAAAQKDGVEVPQREIAAASRPRRIAEAERAGGEQRGDVGRHAGAQRGDHHPDERHCPEQRRRARGEQREAGAPQLS